jgi:hypothetical protein
MVAPINIGAGIEIGGGISIGAAGGGGGGANGVVTFAEMTATGNVLQWIESGNTANVNVNGFTLNSNVGGPGVYNGIAIASLTANNQAFFSTYGTGNRTATWAAGSTYSSPMIVNLSNNSGSTIVFFMNEVATFPATFVFPVTFS